METEAYPLLCHNYWCIFVPLQAKLSRLCEQDKVVRNQEEKLQQLHREKVANISLSVSQWVVTPVSLVHVCVCSTRWRRPCCRPVRRSRWVLKTLWRCRASSSSGTSCRAACSAPAERCRASTPYVPRSICFDWCNATRSQSLTHNAVLLTGAGAELEGVRSAGGGRHYGQNQLAGAAGGPREPTGDTCDWILAVCECTPYCQNKIFGHPLLMNRFDYFSHFYEYKS